MIPLCSAPPNTHIDAIRIFKFEKLNFIPKPSMEDMRPAFASWTVKIAGRTVKNRPKADFLLSGQHITKCTEYHSEKVFWDENGKNFRAYGAMVTRLIMFFVMHIYDWYLFDSLHIENIFCIYILYFRWSRNIFCHSEILKTGVSWDKRLSILFLDVR